MAEENLILKARTLVMEYINEYPEHLDHMEDIYPCRLDEIYVILTSAVIGNWTILIKPGFPTDYLYEVTIDKHKHETRLKVYKQHDNLVMPDNKE